MAPLAQIALVLILAAAPALLVAAVLRRSARPGQRRGDRTGFPLRRRVG